MKKQISKIFSSDGELSKNIKGFKPRAEQLEMAQSVGYAIQDKRPLVVEAGTGTGKTFAYLAPALIAGKKTIISTGSKNLQDQLFSRDLPAIKKALNYSGKIALLKGRSNYLCLERLDQVIAQGVLGDKSVLADLSKVRKWNNATKTGDLTECIELAEDSPILPQLTSTAESCLGTDCPNYAECYVAQARKKALNADLVVVNHHLFFADMAVKESGFGELIPNAEVIIFDEATSNLDPLTERRICNNLKQLHITQIVVTHRLNAIQDADTIYVVEKGKIIESGTHVELLQLKGAYYDSVNN